MYSKEGMKMHIRFCFSNYYYPAYNKKSSTCRLKYEYNLNILIYK